MEMVTGALKSNTVNRKNILANIWKFSAKRAVIFMLFIPTLGSLFMIGTFYLYLNQTQDDVLFTHIAGRQRMLSEQLGAYVHMVHVMNQKEDREPLRELVATFDQSLDQDGDKIGRRLSTIPAELRNNINHVKQLWQDIKPAILLVADQPISSPQAIKANEFIQFSIPRLRNLSNEVVLSFELLSHNRKIQIFRILITVLSINLIFLFTGVMITKRYLAERKKAAGALLASKSYTENIITSMTDALFVVAPDATIETVNTAAITLSGYTEDELIGKPIGMVFGEEKGEEAFTKQVLSMVKGKLQVIYDRDPEDFWSLLKTAYLGAVIVGPDGRIVMVNEESESIFGYDQGELIGKMIHELLPVKLRADHENKWVKFMASPGPRFIDKKRLLKAQRKDGTTFEVEVGLVPLQIDGDTQIISIIQDRAGKARWEFIRHTRFGKLFTEEEVFWNVDRTLIMKNGNKIPVLMSGAVMRDDSDEIHGIVIVAKDITERKQAEEEIINLARFPSENPNPIMRIDRQGFLLYANDAAYTLLSDWEMQIGQAVPVVLKELIQETEEKHIKRMDISCGSRIFSISASLSPGAEYINMYADDITDRKRAEEEKAAMEDQLLQAQKMESIGVLAGGIAHDFNNILTPIMTYSDLLLMNVPEDDPKHESLQIIAKSADRAKRLVSQILTLSRQDSLELIPVNITQIVQEDLLLLRSAIPSRIKIIEDIDPDCGAVLCDPSQINQIVINLCTNAYQSMGKKGMLTISLKAKEFNEQDAQRSGKLNKGKYVQFMVSDTGHGMDTKTIKRMYDPFYTTKEVGEGTGLGLSVVYGIVSVLGGEIFVESTLNHGTTFTVFLPVYEKKIEKRVVSMERVKGTGAVLVIDDEENIVFSTKKMLEQSGYQVTGVTKSEMALKIYKQNPKKFDLVILDQDMPKITGSELAEEMLNLNKEQKIIMMTGFIDKEEEKRLRKADILKVMIKPFSFLEMINAVQNVLK